MEGKIAELNSEIKLKVFEIERQSISHEETLANLQQCNAIIEQQRKKIEVRN